MHSHHSISLPPNNVGRVVVPDLDGIKDTIQERLKDALKGAAADGSMGAKEV